MIDDTGAVYGLVRGRLVVDDANGRRTHPDLYRVEAVGVLPTGELAVVADRTLLLVDRF